MYNNIRSILVFKIWRDHVSSGLIESYIDVFVLGHQSNSIAMKQASNN